MILIADSGSTRSSWCVANGQEVAFFETEGYNPYFVDTSYIISSLSKALPITLDPAHITEIHFYGAGCAEDKYYVISNALKHIFINAQSYIEDDLLAAARALLGNKAGFAAILGTGTNTCIYDGVAITHNIDSLGFVLGDEGSGGFIGKKIVSDYIRESMPGDLRQVFFETYGLTANELIDHIYTQPMANRFCATFSKFVNQHIQTHYARKVVTDSFHDLFVNLVSKYPLYRDHSFNCVGSIGYYFSDILAEVAADHGMKLGNIVRSPIRDLVDFHLESPKQYSDHHTKS